MRDDCCNRHPHDGRCPYAPEPPTPICPVCAKETDSFYIHDNEVIGCGECVSSTDAYEWEAEREVAYA